MAKEENKLEKIVSLAKRRGFIFPGSEIYGGLAGIYDYGPFGVELRHNIKQYFWDKFIAEREDVYGMSACHTHAQARMGSIRAYRAFHRPSGRMQNLP